MIRKFPKLMKFQYKNALYTIDGNQQSAKYAKNEENIHIKQKKFTLVFVYLWHLFASGRLYGAVFRSNKTMD